ncbi:MAG: hypothetical protein HDQ88_01220 [Clostridia bacterium]|nr:hypothetical protein [Clostridia bacterium]
MYVITSKMDRVTVGLAQKADGTWYWSESLEDVARFKKKSKARHAWITHRDFVPRTNKKVRVSKLVLEHVETLE